MINSHSTDSVNSIESIDLTYSPNSTHSPNSMHSIDITRDTTIEIPSLPSIDITRTVPHPKSTKSIRSNFSSYFNYAKHNHFDVLPDEMIVYILNYIKELETIARLAQSNKRMNAIAEAYPLTVGIHNRQLDISTGYAGSYKALRKMFNQIRANENNEEVASAKHKGLRQLIIDKGLKLGDTIGETIRLNKADLAHKKNKLKLKKLRQVTQYPPAVALSLGLLIGGLCLMFLDSIKENRAAIGLSFTIVGVAFATIVSMCAKWTIEDNCRKERKIATLKNCLDHMVTYCKASVFSRITVPSKDENNNDRKSYDNNQLSATTSP